MGGANNTQGRVEICEGVWGTVCDDLWGDKEARVVCRQIGLGTSGNNIDESLSDLNVFPSLQALKLVVAHSLVKEQAPFWPTTSSARVLRVL